MTPLTFLYITLSVSVIIIALAVLVVAILVALILWKIRSIVIGLHAAVLDVRKAKEILQTDILANIILYGKGLFQKKRARAA